MDDRPRLSNYPDYPCNKNRCSTEHILHCRGCPEWYSYKTGARNWNTGKANGKWLYTRVYHVVTDLIEGDTAETLSCSKCGFEHEFKESYGWSPVWHYCPNCGAKMDGCEKDTTNRCDGCQYHASEGYCRYYTGCPYAD